LARKYKKKGTAGKIIIAILAFIGLLVLLDKLAGTNIFDTLYNKFIDLIRWIADALKSVGGG